MCRSEPVVPYSAQPGKSGRDCFPHGTEPARHQTITPLRYRVVGTVTASVSLYPSMPQPTRVSSPHLALTGLDHAETQLLSVTRAFNKDRLLSLSAAAGHGRGQFGTYCGNADPVAQHSTSQSSNRWPKLVSACTRHRHCRARVRQRLGRVRQLSPQRSHTVDKG